MVAVLSVFWLLYKHWRGSQKLGRRESVSFPPGKISHRGPGPYCTFSKLRYAGVNPRKLVDRLLKDPNNAWGDITSITQCKPLLRNQTSKINKDKKEILQIICSNSLQLNFQAVTGKGISLVTIVRLHHNSANFQKFSKWFDKLDFFNKTFNITSATPNANRKSGTTEPIGDALDFNTFLKSYQQHVPHCLCKSSAVIKKNNFRLISY